MPVLFAHSFAGDLTHWRDAVGYLAPKRRAVAFDFSGHGGSPAAVGRYSYNELAKDIGAAADAQKLETFVLVGHSMGAAIAAEYAARNATRVKALILVDPPPAPGAIPRDQLQQLLAALDKDPYPVIEQFWQQQMFIDSRAEVRQRLLAGLRRLARNAATELTREAFAVDSSAPLRRYGGPKFAIVTPRNDAPLSLHRAVPDVKHAVIMGTGHWIHLDKPDVFNDALNRMLKSVI